MARSGGPPSPKALKQTPDGTDFEPYLSGKYGWRLYKATVLGSVFSGTLIEDNALSYANFSKLFMTITGAAYLAICIQSFIFARKQRELDTAATV